MENFTLKVTELKIFGKWDSAKKLQEFWVDEIFEVRVGRTAFSLSPQISFQIIQHNNGNTKVRYLSWAHSMKQGSNLPQIEHTVISPSNYVTSNGYPEQILVRLITCTRISVREK